MSGESTPSAELAARTIDQLVAAGLVRAGKRDQLAAKIASGRMRAADWKAEIDFATDPGSAAA